MTHRRHSLRLEYLEDRTTPAQFGIPWADHHVSLSFVPDGTTIDGAPSVLSAIMAEQGLSESIWKQEILRAAQTWLQNADLSIGIVADNGAPFGSAGLSQGDHKFGDIRIAARPLSDEVVAVTVPPGPSSGPRAGDIVFNSDYNFGVGASTDYFDVYSIALQEIGHALGIGNSTDINSPMYEIYQGVRTGITSADQAKVQSLYGSRSVDSFDQIGSNESIDQATVISTPTTLNPLSTPIVGVSADVSSTSDMDFYRFTVPMNSNGSITVRLMASGQSLLVSRFSVFTSVGVLKIRDVAVSPLANDITLTVSNVIGGRVYYLQVEKALGSNPFSTGSYGIEINFNPTSPLPIELTEEDFLDDSNSNDTFNSATVLDSVGGNNKLFVTDGIFGNGDVDVYRIHTPAEQSATNSGPGSNGSGTTGTGSGSSGSGTGTGSAGPLGGGAIEDFGYTLTATIRSSNPCDGLLPTVAVYNAAGVALNHRVIRNSNGEMVLQVENVAADADVFLVAAADRVGTVLVGGYHLEANLGLPSIGLHQLYSGGLKDASRIDYHTLIVKYGSVTQFVVEVGGPALTTGVGVQFTVFNLDGGVVLNMFTKPNRAISAARFLSPGEYTLRIKGMTQLADAVLPDLTFAVRNVSLSDPIGPGDENPDTYDDDYDDYDQGDDYYGGGDYDDPGDPDW